MWQSSGLSLCAPDPVSLQEVSGSGDTLATLTHELKVREGWGQGKDKWV